MDAPILEFGPTAEAILEPARIVKPVAGIPEHASACFFNEVIGRLTQKHAMRTIEHRKSEIASSRSRSSAA